MEIGVKSTGERLRNFERKYATSTKEFLKSWTSENLKGKDNEYIEWYGEYEILQRLKRDLEVLRKVKRVD